MGHNEWGQLPHKDLFQVPAPLCPDWSSMRGVEGAERKCHCLPDPGGTTGGEGQAHLPTVPNRDEGTDGLEGPRATCQQVGPVERMKNPHKVGTLGLGEKGGRLMG